MRARAHAAPGIQRWRVEHHDVALALRCATAVDDLEGTAGQGLRELAGVADRGRAADDPRGRAVVGTDPQQATQDVGDVAAEDAPVGVRLVDDDETELLEELEPLRVVGQDGRAQHVRVGDHHLAGLADDGPDGRRRVTVVDGRGEVHLRQRREVAELRQLVLAQSLGGKEVERPSGAVVGDGLQDGEVVAERLAGGRGRHDGHVAALSQRLDGLSLVAVEAADAAKLEGPDQAGIEPVGQRRPRSPDWPAARAGRPGQQPPAARPGSGPAPPPQTTADGVSPAPPESVHPFGSWRV